MGDSIRILLVDDDTEVVEVTARALEREDDRFVVRTAADADAGYERFREERFECLVSDYNLPGEDGIEFLEAVRATSPDLPFILYTGTGSEDVASEAISAGVTDYLQKRAGYEQYELLANRIDSAVAQYRTARELERQNDLFEKAEDMASIGAFESELGGEPSYLSDEILRIHGLDADADLPPEKSIGYYHPEDRPQIREAFENAVEHGEPYDLELRLLTDDGDLRWVRTRGEPRSEDGEVVRIRGVLQDVTERKRRELKLERQRDRLEQFAQVVSHDIRNPLQVAKGHLEEADRTGSEEAFRKIREANQRIEAITDDVLTLARQGQEIGETEPVEIDELAREAWNTVDTDDLTLRTIAGFEVAADRDRLRQLFENLFRNCAEHGPRTSKAAGDSDAHDTLSVTVGPIDPLPTSTREPTEGSRGFYVADDGVGIPETDRETVFESGTTTTDAGTGFGLAIVAEIAEAHGWTASVVSSRTGGARFEFRTSLGATDSS